MKNHIILLAVLAALLAHPACKKKPGQELGVTVQFSAGDVRIVTAAGEKAAVPGDIITFDDSIVTGASSVVDLNFGTRGIIRIVENSRVTMAALRGPSGNEQAQFEMKTGKVVVIMSKLSKGSGFSIITPTTLAAIRGTSFMVVSDPASSKIYVLKGRILVQLAKEGKLAENIEKILDANKKVIVSEDLVNQIIAGKKEIEVAALTPKEISDIKEEIKDIKTSDTLDPEARKELNEIISAEATPETIKNKKQETKNKDIQAIPSL